MATVDKNFRIKNGLVVEGNVATVNGKDILTKDAGDSYIINLIGGSADTANTPNTVVKRDGNGNFAAGTITATFVGDVTGTVSSLSNHNTDDLAEGTNLYFTNQRAIDAGDGVFDAYGAASAARTAAENTAASDATTKVAAEAALRVSGDAASVLTAANDATSKANAAQAAAEATASADATSKANAALASANSYTDGRETAITTAYQSYADTAEQDAKDYADNLINDASNLSTEVWSAYKTSTEIGLAQAAAEQHADDAVAALVGSAPAVLDTIQELATALENNPDIIADLENVAAGKQNTLTAGSNIDITNDTISVTGLDTDDVAEGPNRLYFTNTRAQDAIGAGTGLTKDNQGTELAINRQAVDTWYDAAGAAATAETNAIAHADGLAGNYEASGNVEAAVNNLVDGTTEFTKVSIGWMTDQVASYVYANNDTQVTAYSWNKYAGASAKFLVRMKNGIHSQVSEILLTKDDADNIAITEYGIVTTNGILGDITAAVNGSDIELKVTPEHNTGTEIIVSGTLMSYGD